MIDAKVSILETTLRDGNYLVDFQFTARDTAWLTGELEACGLRHIEIGHGLGLGASAVHKPAAASDEDYIRAARQAATEAKIGMFAIPGVAGLDDIAMAADLGLDFVRIGANVDQVGDMAPFIEAARARGLFVCTNFMKSYGLPPEEFGRIGARAEGYGSQLNYVVDSAGGMLPEDVRAYFQALAAETGIPTGFHGHDNVRLAMANSLVAVDCGARWIDTTLFGIGRGSGNAATELLASILKQRFGLLAEVDEMRLMHLAESEAVPLLRHRHQETISASLGLAQVHSMYLDMIITRARAEGLDEHALIAEVGALDRLTVNRDILDRAVAAARCREDAATSSDAGLLSLPDAATLEDKVHAAENLAEKLGVPCRVVLANDRDGGTVTVTRRETRVEVRVTGEIERVAAAVRRPVTSIELAANLSGREKVLRAIATRPISLVGAHSAAHTEAE